MGLKILTDSTSDIREELKRELDIRTVSLAVTFGSQAIREEDIDNEEFYKAMEEKGIPTSSQPSIAEIYEAMDDVLAQGGDLLCVFLSSKLSGTFNTAYGVAEKLREEYPERKIYVLDSLSTSMELGYTALVAGRAAKEGKDIEEVRQIAEDNIRRSRFIFIPASLKYLEAGGRIGGASALIGNVLRIIPILTVKDGRADILKKIRTKKKAVNTMIREVMDNHRDFTIKEIVVHHINNYDEGLVLAEKIGKKLNLDRDIDIVDIGPIVGMHVGPGAIGFAYYTEKDLEL